MLPVGKSLNPSSEKQKGTGCPFVISSWGMDKKEAMRAIRDQVITVGGELMAERVRNGTFPVLGEGSHEARILFVGEAPGKNEAETGRPFCGAAGRVLDELIASLGLKREDVYITNVVKDRPPNNRDPRPEEIELYAPFLDHQIDVIRPKVIATLGRFSMDYVMRRYGLEHQVESISRIHGKVFKTQMEWGSMYVVPLFHPAVALYRASQKAELLEDAKVLLGCLV